MSVLPGVRAAVVAAIGLSSLALGGCTSAMREYREVMRGRVPCNCDEGSPWCDYVGIMRGETGCPESGRSTCDCATPCAAPCKKPCASPRKAPCAAPCAPPPTAPCARPVSVVPAAPCGTWVDIPARYETVTERVMTICATRQEVWVPPVLESRVTRRCVVPETRTVIDLPCVTKSIDRCESTCPPRTETRSRTVSDGCGGCRTVCETVTLPPATSTRVEDVLIVAPERFVVWEPAVWSADVCDVEVRPGRWETLEVPAVYETVTRLVCVAPARRELRPSAPPPVPVAVPTPAPTPAPVPVGR